jgi:hypothetical protein
MADEETNGGAPTSISYMMHPRAYASLRASTSRLLPMACSGLS